MAELKTIEIPYLKTKFSDIDVYIFSMKVKDILEIQYVAVRNSSTEEGAVQRILNRSRIQTIKEFVLKGNMFFNTFILNWTDETFPPKILKDNIKLTLQGRRAQVIDGQHRLMGLQAAINEDKSIEDKEVLVTLCLNLSTKEAAKIFLNINSEQKPVPKSLIYDLFGEAVEDKEHSLNRSKDIIDYLNDSHESPLYGRIKYPGKPRGQGDLNLSIVVSALKSHLESDGIFSRSNLNEIETQQKIIFNFFESLSIIYEKEGIWDNKSKNPFLKAAGFNGAIEFLAEELIPKCQERKSFSTKTFTEIMNLDEDNLLLNDELKNLDGKTARKRVKEYFIKSLNKNTPDISEYEF